MSITAKTTLVDCTADQSTGTFVSAPCSPERVMRFRKRPGKRARHHDSAKNTAITCAGIASYRRHTGPCRLRRRGRARAIDGRLGVAAGRRDGGPDAATALSRRKHSRWGFPLFVVHQQGRSPWRTARLGARSDLRPVRPSRREPDATRFPGRPTLRPCTVMPASRPTCARVI